MTASKHEQVFALLLTVEDERPKGSHGIGDGTVERLQREGGFGEQTIRRGLAKLKIEGRAHIYAWTNGVSRAPVWVRGPGKDEPKPAPKTVEQIKQGYAERMRLRGVSRATSDERDGVLKEQTLQHIEWARQNPQTWFGALPGASSINKFKEAA